MGVKLNTASGGSVSIEPTNTASNYTLTVPATTGTVITTDSSGAVSLPRIDSNTEGGQLNFNRASDNSGNWSIDSYGSGSTPSLRFIDGATVRMSLDGSGNFAFNSGYGSSATAYGCRAWVNFNGTGTVSIRASGNVSSVSDDGTGTYTINFTNAMPDANYNVISNGPPNSTTVVGGLGFVVRNSSPSGSPSNKTTTQVQMMYAGTGSLVDASELYASVFR